MIDRWQLVHSHTDEKAPKNPSSTRDSDPGHILSSQGRQETNCFCTQLERPLLELRKNAASRRFSVSFISEVDMFLCLCIYAGLKVNLHHLLLCSKGTTWVMVSSHTASRVRRNTYCHRDPSWADGVT